MREAELRRNEAMAGNWRIFYVGILGAVLVMAIMYFLMQYVVKDHGYYRNQSYPVNNGTADDTSSDVTSHQGGAILIQPNQLRSEPAVYFS